VVTPERARQVDLRSWFHRRGEEGQSATVAAPRPAFALYPPRGQKGLDPTRLDCFGSRLEAFRRRHLRQSEPRLFGALQILDLDLIRRRFGARWVPLREKIFQIIEHALDRELGPDDLYLVFDERTVYLFVTGIAREAAVVRMRLAAARITERLCGLVPGGAAIRVQTLPFDLDSGLAGVTGPRELRARIEAFEREVEDAERRCFHDNAKRLAPRLLPLVHLRKRLVAAYRLEARYIRPDGGELAATSLCPERVSGVFDAELDAWSVSRLVDLGTAWRERAGRSLLVLPVHYETLAQRRLREPLLLQARRLARPSERFLLFELLELPPGVPQGWLHELLMYLKPFCHGFAVRLYPEMLTTEPLTKCGVEFLSLSAAAIEEREDGFEIIDRWAGLAREVRMRSALLDISRRETVAAAKAAGVDYAAGRVIAPGLTDPLPRGLRAL